LLRLKDVTVELVDLLVQELQGNRDIWSRHKRADQEDLGAQHLRAPDAPAPTAPGC
jgi:type I restriction enzyme R subunit